MIARGRLLYAWVAGLVFLGPLCGAASADDAWMKKWRESTARNQIGELEELLTDERLDELSKSAQELFMTAATLEQYGGPLSRTSPERIAPLLDRVHARAFELGGDESKNARYRLARAYATAARCRHRQLNGHKKSQPEWLRAANAVAKLSEQKEVAPELALVAAGWLGEAAQCRAEKHVDLMARAKEIIDAAAGRDPKEEDLQAALGGWYVARARVGRVKKNRGYGKAAVVDGLAYLQPHLGAASLPPKLGVVHMQLLAENLAGKFGVKADMRLKTGRLDKLYYEIPDSAEWEVHTDENSGNKTIVQRMLGGVTRRVLYVSSWKEDVNLWVDQAQSVQVSLANSKKVAEAMRGGFEEYTGIDQVTNRTKVKKARLHKDFTDVWRFCIEGPTKEKGWSRVHAYYFKTKKGNRTYHLRVTEYQRETEEDPVFEFVLENMRLKK